MTGGWAATTTLPGKPPYRIAGIPAGIISADDYDVTDEALAYLSRAALVETALDAADDAIANCLPVLAIEGSDKSGYRWSGSVQTTYVALLQEWRDAAEAICAAHAALRAVREGATNVCPNCGRQIRTQTCEACAMPGRGAS